MSATYFNRTIYVWQNVAAENFDPDWNLLETISRTVKQGMYKKSPYIVRYKKLWRPVQKVTDQEFALYL